MSVIRCQGWKQGINASEGWSGYGVSVLTVGWTGAKEEGHPQVRWACVKDNLEFLRGCSICDVTHVQHLQIEGGSGLVKNWLPSIPTLMSPSGCYISLEITFQPLWSSQPLITEVLAFDFFFSCATLYAGYWFYDQALKWYFLHWKLRGITTGHPGPLDTQGSPSVFIWETL